MIARLLFAAAALAITVPACIHATPAHSATPAQTAPIQMEHISVQVSGKGSPVILIPGLSSPRAVWDNVAADLAKTHRVYLVQVNGFGGDDPRANLKPGVLDGIVADVHSLIASEKLGSAAVIGHSMGGLAGLMLAKAHPADVSKLMGVDALPFIGSLFMPDAQVAAIEPRAAAMRDAIAATYGKPANAAAAQGTANTLALTPGAREKVTAWIVASDPRVTAHALYEDMVTDLRGDLPAIKTPITLVYAWSAALPKERADALFRGEYAKAPNMSFVPVADSAHFVMLDQPEAFGAAVREFVK